MDWGGWPGGTRSEKIRNQSMVLTIDLENGRKADF